MKNNFHNDVNNENLDIANRILDDSKKLDDMNFSKPELEDIIVRDATYSKQTRKKSHIYTIASAIAACLILVVGFGVWNQEINIKKCNPSTLAQKNFAADYSEIYEKLLSIKSAEYVSDTKYLFPEDCVDSFSDSMTQKDSAKSTANTGTSATVLKESSASSSDDRNYYDTNEQTENVHEGDIVKTDGRYIYTLSVSDFDSQPTLIITKVDGAEMEIVTEFEFEVLSKADLNFETITETELSKKESSAFSDASINMHELYIYNDNLIVIGTQYNYAENRSSMTIIYVFDVSNPKSITLINKLSQDGDYVSSRMKDDFLYTITTHRISNPTLYHCVPNVNGKLMTPDCIYIPEEINNSRYTIITSLNVTKPEDFITSKSVLGGSSNVYASQNNVYVINSIMNKEDISDTKLGKDALEEIEDDNIELYDNDKFTLKGYFKDEIKYYLENYNSDIKVKDVTAYKDTGVYKSTNCTEIIKFEYSDGNIRLVANNRIDGHTEDNLNFDEKDGYLRCVTTENHSTNVETLIKCYDKNDEFLFDLPVFTENIVISKDTNNVFVLDSKLSIVAEINNLAKGESIYSARYMGDYGYFVTYEETDPLFSVDFSDMENPKIIGKLKMPGYSEYLHFYSGNKLLGFGLEESSEDDDDWWSKLKLEMFNVEGGKAEKETKTLLDNYSYSESMYNYKSMMIDPEKNLIGFTAEEEFYVKDEWNYRQYYLVYSYENETFKELYKIKINKYAYDVRGFYIDDYLYVVSPEYGIYAINMKTYNDDKKVERVKFN